LPQCALPQCAHRSAQGFFNELSVREGSAGKSYNYSLQLISQYVEVVLVRPRNPLNIGAAARAMANFGLSRLAVVAPYEPQWRVARSAVGADEVLLNASVTESLAAAVSECTLVIGTGSLARREAEQVAMPLPELGTRVAEELTHGGSVALVFGSEKHGLTREDLSLCHIIVEIPTHPRQPSMNLGQAVAVCLYELIGRTAIWNPAHAEEREGGAKAASAELERLAEIVDEAMQAARYSPAGMRRANQHDLRLLLRRLSLTTRDARRILRLFRRMIWQMNAARRGKIP
jgi:TrmH family RNA methyltransferase